MIQTYRKLVNTPLLIVLANIAMVGCGQNPNALQEELNKVNALQSQQKFAEAQHSLEKLVADYPEDPRPHAWLGYLALGQQQRDIAKTHLQKAAELNSKDAEVWASLTKFHVEEGNLPEAAATATKWTHTQPDSVEALTLSASIASQMGRGYQAFEALQSLAQKMPDDIEIQKQFAQSALAVGRLKEAQQTYTAILAKNAEDATAPSWHRCSK